MSDIVERLRERAASGVNCLCGNPVCDEAAEEILRLRAENERLREALEPIVGVLIDYTEDDYSDYEYAPALIGDLRRARAALEGVTEPAR